MATTAIILAAGMGSRLHPLTLQTPKPLVQVNQRPIILNTLENLSASGIQNVCIVIGYLGEMLTNFIGETYKGMKISYTYNENFAHTNSMYSLWIALNELAMPQEILLIEGDVFFNKEILDNQSNHPFLWWGDSSIANVSGCYLATNKTVVTGIDIYSSPPINTSDKSLFKSAGIFKFAKELFKDIKLVLEKGIINEQQTLYYDLIFSKNLDKFQIDIHDITGMKWFEIDDLSDLKYCEELFKNII